MTSKQLCIEFVGLPGSGKTTISRMVKSRLVSDSLSVVDRIDIANWVDSFGYAKKVFLLSREWRCTYPLLWETMSYVCAIAPVNIERIQRGVRIPMNYIYLSEFKRADTFDICLLDEWILHKIWTVGTMGAQIPHMDQVLRSAVGGGVGGYVYVDIDVQEAARRLVNRSQQRIIPVLRKLSERKKRASVRTDINWMKSMLERHRCMMEQVRECVAISNVPVLFLNGEEQLDENVQRIVEWLHSEEF